MERVWLFGGMGVVGLLLLAIVAYQLFHLPLGLYTGDPMPKGPQGQKRGPYKKAA